MQPNLPLHPMTIGEILDQSFDLYRSHFRILFKLVLMLILPVSILQLLIGLFHYWAVSTSGVDSGIGITSMVLSMISSIIFYIVLFLLTFALVFYAARIILNQPAIPGYAIRYVFSHGVPFIITEILVGLSVLGATILLIIPGILVYTLLSVVAQVMVIEGLLYGDALRRSWSLVREQMGKTFVVLLVTTILVAVISYALLAAVVIPLSIFLTISSQNAQALIGIISSSVSPLFFSALYPFSYIAITLLYFDLRIHNEGLDIEILTQQIAQQEGT